MRVNASEGIVLPQLEEPICCSKIPEPYQGFQLPTIGQYDNLPTENRNNDERAGN
jgi:hypothetical protein